MILTYLHQCVTLTWLGRMDCLVHDSNVKIYWFRSLVAARHSEGPSAKVHLKVAHGQGWLLTIMGGWGRLRVRVREVSLYHHHHHHQFYFRQLGP